MGNESFNFEGFSDKASEFYFESNAFINIAHGSVRSGKTITASLRFIHYIDKSPHKKFLITGKTRDTIKRNVIDDMLLMMDGDSRFDYSYHHFDGVLRINDNTVYAQ